MKMPSTQVEYVKFGGGLDLVSPPLSIAPGFVREAQNYELGVSGGYVRVDGYERYSGKAAPSDAIYLVLPATITGAVAAGDAILGGSSGATGQVIAVESAAIIYTLAAVATFTGTETVKVGGTVRATATSTPVADGVSTVQLHAQYKNLAADVYRALIAAPTGTGAILGIKYYAGNLYCVRNAANGLSAILYKATASGWSAVTFGYEVAFTTGAVAEAADGETLTQGGVTATVSRSCIRTGTIGAGTAAGRLIIGAPAGGNFAAGAATLSGSGTLTLSGAQTAITLAPSGRFSFVNYNFGSGLRMYGCDGVNRAFEFDGTTFVPLTTGMTTDKPKYIAAHKNHLFLTFDKSLQHSSIARPYAWSPVTGAAEINLGDTITSIIPQPSDAQSGGAMACFTRNRTYLLYGNSSADWNLITLQQDAGALPYSAQNIGGTYVLDDRGVTSLATTANFGNFESASVSSAVRPWIIENKGLATDSCIVREKNQYRLIFDGGRALYLTFAGNKPAGFMPMVYPDDINLAESTELSDGSEAIFYGSSAGMVYRADKGTSFDGAAIESYITFVFNHSKSPRSLKQYRKAVLEVSGTGYSEMYLSAELGYASDELAQISATSITAAFSAGTWDSGLWDVAFWDGRILLPAEQELIGNGENISLRMAQISDYFVPITFHGVLIHFTPRRALR